MYLKVSQKMSVVMKLLWNCSANLSSTFYSTCCTKLLFVRIIFTEHCYSLQMLAAQFVIQKIALYCL